MKTEEKIFKSLEISLTEMLRENLCYKLRYLVSAAGVRQKDLAADLGLDEGNLSRVLNSKFNFGVDTLLNIVDALGFELAIVVNPPVEIVGVDNVAL